MAPGFGEVIEIDGGTVSTLKVIEAVPPSLPTTLTVWLPSLISFSLIASP